ncbi:MAG TPA: hypothetical protein VMO80_16995 [Terriglobales bacterium]|nr:hypothetical protein [Terriglobales bacterium]
MKRRITYNWGRKCLLGLVRLVTVFLRNWPKAEHNYIAEQHDYWLDAI